MNPSIIGRYLCWFDFTNFINVKHILNGGFSRIYSATSLNLGIIFKGNNFPVILKIVRGSRNEPLKFITEVNIVVEIMILYFT